MTNQAASVEIWEDADTGWLRCAFGNISLSNVWPNEPGVVQGMGPLILVTVPFDSDTFNLAQFGVDFTVTDGIARTRAKNGTWFHRVQPAHWRDGAAPMGWSQQIMLGRWTD
jgi:hypothetical protein